MIIEDKKVVSITYKLQENDSNGEIIQEVAAAEPFQFLFGAQQVLPDFEKNLQGKTSGDNFEFGIVSNDAYGPHDPQALVELPINIFMVDGKIADTVQMGAFLPMNDQDGNPMQGLVLEIAKEHVKMDFNHPLAGMDLFFSGDVLEVREAKAEEMEHGHAHGPEGHED